MPLDITIGNAYYFSDEYKVIIRSCKEILLAQANYTPFIEPGIVFAYRYNFHKFLRSLRTENGGESSIPEDLIWTISYINDMENPNSDFSKLPGIYTVTKEIVDRVIAVARVRRE